MTSPTTTNFEMFMQFGVPCIFLILVISVSIALRIYFGKKHKYTVEELCEIQNNPVVDGKIVTSITNKNNDSKVLNRLFIVKFTDPNTNRELYGKTYNFKISNYMAGDNVKIKYYISDYIKNNIDKNSKSNISYQPYIAIIENENNPTYFINKKGEKERKFIKLENEKRIIKMQRYIPIAIAIISFSLLIYELYNLVTNYCIELI